MKVREEKESGVLICNPEGEINIDSSPDLRKAFDTIIKNNEKKVLVDFSGVSYIDSSGLATLVEMLQRLRKIGGNLRFCAMQQKIKNSFEITKLDKLFAIFEEREEALRGF